MRSSRFGKSLLRARNGATFSEGRRGMKLGVLPTLEPQMLLSALRPSMVVDVGANRGQFSLDVRRALPEAKLVAFEPLESEAKVYRQVFRSVPNFSLYVVALGATVDDREMQLSKSRDSSSLLEISPLQDVVFPGTGKSGTEIVRVEQLDMYQDCFATSGDRLLKIDVQGGELEVLRGGLRAIKSFRWILIELSFVELYVGQPMAHEVVRFLDRHGFRLSETGTPQHSLGRAVQVDVLFEKV